jgi:hypothetical protein
MEISSWLHSVHALKKHGPSGRFVHGQRGRAEQNVAAAKPRATLIRIYELSSRSLRLNVESLGSPRWNRVYLR